jgi:NADPH-ferrihemoprotein reductase
MSSEMTTQPTITPAAGLLLGLITVSVGLYLYYRPPASQSSAAIAKTFDKYSDRPKTPPHTTSSSDSTSTNTTTTTTTDTTDTPAKEKYPCGPMRVYFGSQTGTAEEFAQTLVEEGKARGFDAAVVDLEDFQEEDFTSAPLNKALHMFAVATYGEGEPTDNAIDFFKWLKKDVDELPSTLKFCVFGLGNTQYDHFNAMGRKINQILEEKGAVRVADYGEGDDDGTMDEDFETWRDQLWPQLATAFGGTVSQKKDGEPPDWSPMYKVTWMEEGADAEKLKRLSKSARNKVISKVNKGIAANDPDTKIALSSQSYFAAKEVRVVSNAELRKDGGTFDGSVDADGNFGSTIQVEFDLNGSDLTYNTADTLAVCPENDPEIVEMVSQTCNYYRYLQYQTNRSFYDEC